MELFYNAPTANELPQNRKNYHLLFSSYHLITEKLLKIVENHEGKLIPFIFQTLETKKIFWIH